MGLRPSDLELLIEAFEASPWTEMVVTVHGTRLELTSTGSPPSGAAAAAGPPGPSAAPEPPGASAAAPAPPAGMAAPVPASAAPAPASAAPAPASTAAPAPAPPAGAGPSGGPHEVRAPSVGIFYRAPAPGAPPFVQEGARVAPDDILCIVEVMKLMNHVRAEVAGVVRGVHADDAAMIEHGQLLFTIDASG